MSNIAGILALLESLKNRVNSALIIMLMDEKAKVELSQVITLKNFGDIKIGVFIDCEQKDQDQDEEVDLDGEPL